MSINKYLKNINNKELLSSLLVFGICLLSIYLYFSNKLSYYIHPRYFIFCLVMSIIGLLMFAISLTTSHHHSEKYRLWPLLIVFIFFIAVIPIQSLSPRSAIIRGLKDSNLQDKNTKINLLQRVNDDMTFLTIDEWSSLLAQSQNSEIYKLKKAKITGFITKQDSNIFQLTRFKLSCCAVDAQPISITIYRENWQSSYKEGQWLTITGQFDRISGLNNLVLIPSEIQAIELPERPYL